MTGSDPLSGGDFPFGDLSKLFEMFGNADPWAQAAQIAQAVAADGESEPNVEPKIRMALTDLGRVAGMYLKEVPGVGSTPAMTGDEPTIRPVTRAAWTTDSLTAYRQFFERFGEAIDVSSFGNLPEAAADPMSMMFSQMFANLAPTMVAASAGSMIGHLGQHALGQYDLPVPRPGNDVLIVASAVDRAAEEWDLPIDELRMWILVHELATHSVLSVPHIRKHLDQLFIDFATAFRLDPEKFAEQFGDLQGLQDLNQIQELAGSLDEPEAILELMRTRTHDLLLPQLDTLVAIILGVVDLAVERVCLTLVPAYPEILARMRSRILEVSPADRFMEQLLGISITESTLDRGRAFVDGVIERAGDEGIVRLLGDELDLPTPAELSAPGLWLARIGLDPDLPMDSLEVPDDLSGLDDF